MYSQQLGNIHAPCSQISSFGPFQTTVSSVRVAPWFLRTEIRTSCSLPRGTTQDEDDKHSVEELHRARFPVNISMGSSSYCFVSSALDTKQECKPMLMHAGAL